MDTNKVTQVHHTSDEDLTKSIAQTIKDLFASYTEKSLTKKEIIWITRKQVAEILSISLVTVDDWTNRNILTAYRISNKKRYKLSEVDNALTKIEK